MGGWLTANLDYIIYVAACAAVFALLEWWLRRRAYRGRLPRWSWPLLAGLLAGGWFLVQKAGEAEKERIQFFLQGVAPTYAQEVERLGHAKLTLQTPPDDPTYLSLVDATLRWKKVSPIVSDVYTYRMIDGKVRFVVDSETDYNHNGVFDGDREKRTPIGREYPEADDEMKQALQGVSTFSPEPVRDEWGVWVSAQVPLHDGQGRVEAALGVDYPAEQWLRAIALGRQRMEWFLAIPVLLLGFGAALTGALRAELIARLDIEARSRESEARLMTAVDALPCNLWMLGTDGRYILFNAAACRDWGDHAGRTFDDLNLAPDTKKAWGEINRRAFAGETVRHEVTYELRGLPRHYLCVVAPVMVDGKVTAILGVNLDVTERQESEAALRRSEDKLALHVRQTPLAVIEWNVDRAVTAWNPAAERIFGYKASEVIGKSGTDFLVPPAARAAVDRVWHALLSHRGGTRSTNENLTKDGRIIVCEWYNTPLIDDAGRVIGAASHAQDVTERDALERQLRQAQKMESVGQLAGGVAHEFNNLLTPMLMQTDLLTHEYASDERLVRLLKPVLAAIQQASQLNQRILAVGRRSLEQRELLRLNTLVENAVALLRPSLDRRIELEVKFEPNLPPLSLDRSHIPQVVMNLALNARDALLEKIERGQAPAGWTPRITISTEQVENAERSDGNSAMPFMLKCQRLTVADNAGGIPPDIRARIFEPFFTTKAPGRGTGLGLAIVWNVVHSLGGWIELADGLDGTGTSFQIYLPLPQGVPAAVASDTAFVVEPPARRAATAKPLRVLLVEDNALVAETFILLLTSRGHQVVSANDGEEGWELFNRRNGEFDLVLADYNMPRLNGADLLRRVKGTGFAGRVVIASGYLTPEKLAEVRQAGADAVLRKPFTPDELIAAVEKEKEKS